MSELLKKEGTDGGTSNEIESPTESITALEYIQTQMQMEQDAREALPYDPNRCTYHDQPVRQQLYACLTCKEKNEQPNCICYSCCIQCHSNHTLVELFTKRNMSCDCGTHQMASFGACNLRKNFDMIDKCQNNQVLYGHNYSGNFCVCDRTYDPDREHGIMFQCLLGDACGEDWFHEECILGIPFGSTTKGKERQSIKNENESKKEITAKMYPEGVNVYDQLESASSEHVKAPEDMGSDTKANGDDTGSENSGDEDEEDETLEGIPNQGEFESFICWQCVEKHKKVLHKWEEWPAVALRGVPHGSFNTLEERNMHLNIDSGNNENGKREHSDDTSLSNKKLKVESGEKDDTITNPNLFSLFLVEGYQDVLNKSTDPETFAFLTEFPFLKEQETVYQPPEDDDANSSLYDAGTRALNSLPREKAIDGLHAYSMIKERLSQFLKPFAEQGKVVTETDVNTFFASVEMERRK